LLQYYTRYWGTTTPGRGNVEADQELGIAHIFSQELARRYHISAAKIHKDLTQFGEFGRRRSRLPRVVVDE
jgi:hypothetical protein